MLVDPLFGIIPLSQWPTDIIKLFHSFVWCFFCHVPELSVVTCFLVFYLVVVGGLSFLSSLQADHSFLLMKSFFVLVCFDWLSYWNMKFLPIWLDAVHCSKSADSVFVDSELCGSSQHSKKHLSVTCSNIFSHLINGWVKNKLCS